MSLDGEVWERGRVRAGSAQHSSGLLHRETEIRELNGRARRAGAGDRGAEREREAVEARRRARSLEERHSGGGHGRSRRDALERPVARARGGRARASLGGAGGGGARSEIATHRGRGSIRWRARWPRPRPSSRVPARARARPARQLVDLDGVVHALEARARGGSGHARRMRARRCSRLSREEGEWEAPLGARRADAPRARGRSRGARRRTRRPRARVSPRSTPRSRVSRPGSTGLLETESTQRDRVGRAAAALPGAQGRDRCRLEEAARQQALRADRAVRAAPPDRARARAVRAPSSTAPSSDCAPSTRWIPSPWTLEPIAGEGSIRGRPRASSRTRARGCSSLGAVNLLALEEYTKKKERYQFLVQQRERSHQRPGPAARGDREDQRHRAASCSSRPSRKVQEHFRDVFKTLFEGGDAELRTVGEDPLECEIEIAAKPRGKHLQSISLMSGGERALTGDRAAVRDLPGQAVAVLPARRGRRAARRRQRRPLPQHAPALQRQDPVRRDHAQQEDDGGRRLPLRRDHAGARRLDARVGEVRPAERRAPTRTSARSWPTAAARPMPAR